MRLVAPSSTERWGRPGMKMTPPGQVRAIVLVPTAELGQQVTVFLTLSSNPNPNPNPNL